MKLVKVSNTTTMVDDEDFELVSQYKWWLTKAGYPYTQTCVKNKRTAKGYNEKATELFGEFAWLNTIGSN